MQGRLGAPLNVVTRRAEMKYTADDTPERFTLDGSANGADVSVRTSFVNGTAQTEGNQGTAKIATSHQLSPKAVVLPNGVFSLYAALADRLSRVTAGAELKAYILPLAEIGVRVVSDQPERIQVGTAFLDVQRYDLLFSNPGGDLAVSLTAGDGGRLIRLSIPAQSIEVVREDVASPTSRTQVFSNPGDEAVVIPAVGFNLGATITKPSSPAPRMPAVILLSGSGVGDRDGFVQGVPTLAQLAGAIADAGFLAVRYDKRGFGQSGGRAESATIQDYAEDVRAVVRWLLQRKDIDPKRIAVVGHSEGAWVALLAAAREKRISAVASIAGPATTGAELVLEQQQRALDQMKLTPEERDKKVALQKQIQSAVITGKGWELRSAGGAPRRGHAVVPEPADVRSGEGHQGRSSAAVLRARGAGQAGAGHACRSPCRYRAQAKRLRFHRGRRRARRESPVDSGIHRRSHRVRLADRPQREQGHERRAHRVAHEDVRRHQIGAERGTR